MKKFFGKLWEGWKRVAHRVGRFNTRVILTIFYFVVAGMACAIMKIFRSDPIARRRPSGDSFWQQYEAVGDRREQVRRLF